MALVRELYLLFTLKYFRERHSSAWIYIIRKQTLISHNHSKQKTPMHSLSWSKIRLQMGLFLGHIRLRCH